MKEHQYDRFVYYLGKQGEIPKSLALDMLTEEYKHRPTARNTLKRLIKSGTVSESFHDNMAWLRAGSKVPIFPEKRKDEVVEATAAILYRYFVRYGAQHFSAPGRIKFMSIMKRYIDRYRRQYEFYELLIDLIDNPPSTRGGYLAIQEALKKTGWDDREYDAADIANKIVGLVRDKSVTNFLGCSDEDWEGLDKLDDLSRIKEAPEQDSWFNPGSDYIQLDYETEEAGLERIRLLKAQRAITSNGASD